MEDMKKLMGKAIIEGDLETVKKMIKEEPALLHEETIFGTWLHRAAIQGQLEIAQYLIDEGIDVNQNGGILERGAISGAITNGKLDMVKLLVKNNVVFDTSTSQRNPLFCAISSRNSNMRFETVKYLIEQGIDLSAKYEIYNVEEDAYLYSKYNGTEEITAYIAQKMKEKNIIPIEAKEQKKRIYDSNHKPNLEEAVLKEMFAAEIKESVASFTKKYSKKSILAISYRMYYDAYKPEDRYQCEIIMQTKEDYQKICKKCENEEELLYYKFTPEEYKYAKQGTKAFEKTSDYLFQNCLNLEVCYELEDDDEREKMEEAILEENQKIEKIFAETVADLRKEGIFKDKEGNDFYVFPYVGEDDEAEYIVSLAKIMNQGLDMEEYIGYFMDEA